MELCGVDRGWSRAGSLAWLITRLCWETKRLHQLLLASMSLIFMSHAIFSACSMISDLVTVCVPRPTDINRRCSISGYCALLHRRTSNLTPEATSAWTLAMLSGRISFDIVMRDLANIRASSACQYSTESAAYTNANRIVWLRVLSIQFERLGESKDKEMMMSMLDQVVTNFRSGFMCYSYDLGFVPALGVWGVQIYDF